MGDVGTFHIGCDEAKRSAHHVGQSLEGRRQAERSPFASGVLFVRLRIWHCWARLSSQGTQNRSYWRKELYDFC